MKTTRVVIVSFSSENFGKSIARRAHEFLGRTGDRSVDKRVFYFILFFFHRTADYTRWHTLGRVHKV